MSETPVEPATPAPDEVEPNPNEPTETPTEPGIIPTPGVTPEKQVPVETPVVPDAPDLPVPEPEAMKTFEELDAMADAGELDEATLMHELQKYQQAIKEEFEMSLKNAPVEDTEEYVRDFFRKNIASAAAQVAWLAIHSDSDSVKLNASKYMLAMAIDEANGEGDPIKNLLKDLQTKPAPTAEELQS